MADKYSCFADLAAHEQDGVDYRVEIERRNSPIAIIAPHGGKIEPMTTELAQLITGDHYNFYSFVGIKKTGNRDLHVTSHHFDEPKCLELISGCDIVVAIHGRKDKEDQTVIYLGGLDRALSTYLSAGLQGAGFATQTSGHEFPAKNPANICNRGKRRIGVQLELPWTLRDGFRAKTELRQRFVRSVQLSIADFAGSLI